MLILKIKKNHFSILKKTIVLHFLNTLNIHTLCMVHLRIGAFFNGKGSFVLSERGLQILFDENLWILDIVSNLPPLSVCPRAFTKIYIKKENLFSL